MSSGFAGGTRSVMRGDRFSVRLPSRIVAICVSDPIGFDLPRRTLSTPAMNVVATAPSPGVRMPNRPVAGGMFPVFESFDGAAKSQCLLSAMRASLPDRELVGWLHG